MTENIIIALITAVSMVVGAIISGYFGYKSGTKKQKQGTLALEDHPYFQRVECIRNEIIRTFSLPNKGKEAVFKDILFENIDILIAKNTAMVEEIVNHEDKYGNNVDLYNLQIENLESITTTLYTFYKDSYRYSDEDKEVLDIVMMKYSRWSQERLHIMQDQIYQTCNSPFYADSSAVLKSSIILDQYLSFTIETVNNASATLNKINGDLRGLTYKGITI